MRHFSIKELERFSGIKAHTIRIWEQRHSIFTPQRTDANLRRYSLQDVKLLLDISLLIKSGYKISKLAGLLSTEIRQRIMAMTDKDARKSRAVNDLIYCMYATNMEEFELVIEGSLLSWGFDATIKEIILPFLEKVELLSYKNSSAEAHFAVTAIRRKLIFGIESLNTPAADSRTVLLFLPKDEHYDLMLLYVFYMLKKAGFKPLYLGTNISIKNMEKVCAEKEPALLYTYTHPEQTIKVHDYNALLEKHCPTAQLYILHMEQESKHYTDLNNVHFLNYGALERSLL